MCASINRACCSQIDSLSSGRIKSIPSSVFSGWSVCRQKNSSRASYRGQSSILICSFSLYVKVDLCKCASGTEPLTCRMIKSSFIKKKEKKKCSRKNFYTYLMKITVDCVCEMQHSGPFSVFFLKLDSLHIVIQVSCSFYNAQNHVRDTFITATLCSPVIPRGKSCPLGLGDDPFTGPRFARRASPIETVAALNWTGPTVLGTETNP